MWLRLETDVGFSSRPASHQELHKVCNDTKPIAMLYDVSMNAVLGRSDFTSQLEAEDCGHRLLVPFTRTRCSNSGLECIDAADFWTQTRFKDRNSCARWQDGALESMICGNLENFDLK